ncbi:hypothetical protein EV401DRAFT_1886928 [Pisolithus croceorrhizus]|nr:hypothetical protein EV401DRAFT_1886928 [Pisolithus croceorrhizus]
MYECLRPPHHSVSPPGRQKKVERSSCDTLLSAGGGYTREVALLFKKARNLFPSLYTSAAVEEFTHTGLDQIWGFVTDRLNDSEHPESSEVDSHLSRKTTRLTAETASQDTEILKPPPARAFRRTGYPESVLWNGETVTTPALSYREDHGYQESKKEVMVDAARLGKAGQTDATSGHYCKSLHWLALYLCSSHRMYCQFVPYRKCSGFAIPVGVLETAPREIEEGLR